MLRGIMDSPVQLLIVAGLAVLLFGGRRLPEAARGLGRSLRIFKSEIKEMKNDDAGASEALEGKVVAQESTKKDASAE